MSRSAADADVGFHQRFANNGNQFSVEPPDQALCVGPR
jgi:hypothetical protein